MNGGGVFVQTCTYTLTVIQQLSSPGEDLVGGGGGGRRSRVKFEKCPFYL